MSYVKYAEGLNKHLQKKLDRLMKKRGINKAQLSRESGIPYTTIDGFYKRGMDNIRFSTLMKLIEYFDIPMDYFIEEEEAFGPLMLNDIIAQLRGDTDMQNFIIRYASITPEQQELVRNMVDQFLYSP